MTNPGLSFQNTRDSPILVPYLPNHGWHQLVQRLLMNVFPKAYPFANVKAVNFSLGIRYFSPTRMDFVSKIPVYEVIFTPLSKLNRRLKDLRHEHSALLFC